MYLNFFNLKKEPFQITPDPEFLFLSASHREALASIIYGIEKRKGFIAITGGVGLGKTTIFRSFLERINKRQIRTVYIFNPNVSFKSLLKTIFQELDIAPRSDEIMDLVNQLHEVLIEEYRQGHNIVLAIDEAQNIPIPTLENLRMLSNLETSKDKLIQIVLIGQPEFEEMLNLHELRQIKQRVAMRSTIMPLTQKESAAYIRHRLARAQADGDAVFSDEAIRKISQKANGIPRIINILCDNALVTAYGYQKKPVTGAVAAEIIRDFDRRSVAAPFRWRYAAVFAAALAIFGAFWIFGRDHVRPPAADTVQLKPEAAPAGEQTAPPRAAAESLPAGLAETPAPAAAAIPGGPSPAPVPSVRQAIRKLPVDDPAGTAAGPELPGPPGEPGPPGIVRNPAPRTGSMTIRRGDTLNGIIMDRYGHVDGRTIARIRQQNPWIKNVNVIYTGYELVLPETEKAKKPAKEN